MKTNIRWHAVRSLCWVGFFVLIFLLFLQPTGAADPSAADQVKLSSLQQKIGELDHAGKYREAIPIAEEHLKLAESIAGPDKAETAASCDKLGELYRKNGDYAKAKPICERGLKIREKVLGPDDPHAGESLNHLASIYVAMGDPKTAEPLCERALKIREKAFGPEHPNTAESLNNLGLLYNNMGDYAKAEPLYQRALEVREKALGSEHPDTAESLNNLAVLYWQTGDYAKAEPLFRRARNIRENALGPEHPDTAKTLNNLAGLYHKMGDYVRAEPLYRRALNIREKTLGLEHPGTASTLNNLAALYYEMGDYARAEPLYQRWLKIREKALGPEHPDTASGLNNLAGLYQEIGDNARAEPLLQRALKICEKALGPEHPLTALSLNNLALLFSSMGDYAKAEPLDQRSLQIREKALGPEHPGTATALNSLAVLYDKMGDYAKAEPLYQRSLQIREKALGPEHPDTATSLDDLASFYHTMGDYGKAEPLLRRSLKIREKVIGPDHPDTARALNHLAFLGIDLGEAKEAIPLLAQVRQAEEKHLSNILSFTSEPQRLEFQKTTDPYSLAAALGSASELAQIVLRQKGVVLDSLLEDRLVAEASGDPKQRAIVDDLRSAKQRLTKLVMEVPKDLSEAARQRRNAEKEKLSAQVEQLEAGLGRQVAGLGRARRALSVTVPQVQAVLPPQAVLIELLRYSHHLGKGKEEPHYGAIVIGAKGDPAWVPFGAAAEIEKSVARYQKSVRGKTDEATLSSVLKKLQDQLWAPIEKALPEDTATVIVSPEAELSFVSFATLLTSEDRFLGEKYSIRYVASGRDLLREVKASVGPNPIMQVFANPDFGGLAADPRLEQTYTAAQRSVEMRDLEGISLPRLPGTEKESAKLEARAKKLGWQVHAYLGAKATEAELRKVNSPRVLHLATHGFFLPEMDLAMPDGSRGSTAEIPKGKLVNPMQRSGLAMAGAQRTLQGWTKGKVPPIENDGVVTAEEVGGLKLEGTWLVALSACDTGGGEARTGEGVLGLRRGFIQARAQNLLMTLWPISDETTVQIMLDFYDAAFQSGNAPQALADTQRDWLVKLRKEQGLLPAVRFAGAFIISSQGKP